MSWSDNRTSSTNSKDEWNSKIIEQKVKQVNAVLEKLSKDDDLQDDLKLAVVKKAIKHWTRETILPLEEALQLQDNRRVVYVLQRLQMLQSVAKDARMSVPLDCLLSGRPNVTTDYLDRVYGSHWNSVEKKEVTASNSDTAVVTNSAPIVPKKEMTVSKVTGLVADVANKGKQPLLMWNETIGKWLFLAVCVITVIIGIIINLYQ